MRLLVIVMTAAVLAGCGASKNASNGNEGTAEQNDLWKFESDFRPSDHDPAARTPDEKHHSPAISEPDHAIFDTTSADLVQGFRVQIFSSTNIDNAKARRAEAQSYFPGEWFYLQYDPPTYKIRAGNFVHRYEADRFVKLAIEKGFTDAWTVPAKVMKEPGIPPH